MTAGERFKNWIDGLSEAWKDRLRGWFASWISLGANVFAESAEPEVQDMMRDSITRIANIPGIPPDYKKALLDSLAYADWKRTSSGWFWYLLGILPSILSSGQPFANLVNYDVELLQRTHRLDPLSVITAWRRDPAKYEAMFLDLKEQGWSDERIEALKFYTLFYPSPRDLIGFMAHEVFEDPLAARYGLDAEIGDVLKHLDAFEKAGMTEEQVRQYWRDHWEHASWMQVVEMLHRGVLTEKDAAPPTTKEGWAARDAEGSALMYDWFKLVEMSTFWRKKLEATSWNVPTRVDVRRWWDMRTISEDELRNIYHRQGYHGTDLDNYILWTKVYVAFPDLIARWSKGWITLDQVKNELTGLGMPAARVEELIQTKLKAAEPERTASERDVTKTDIYKGVKQGVITRGEAIELLQDLGFDEDEADYLLAINIPEDEEDKVVKERQLSKADILKGLKEKVITREEARSKLAELRYAPLDVAFLLKLFDAQVKPPVEPKLREESKADILLGVKKGLITQEEGYRMLLDIGFTPEAADFILFVRTEETPFSPMSYNEFKDLTHKWRKAAGMEAKPMTEELKKAGEEVVRLSNDIKSLDDSITEEKRGLIPDEILPEAATARLKKLQVKRNRAISELERVKSEYDRLVAEWRHGAPE